MNNRKGIIKTKRSTALQIQLPPSTSIKRFNTNVEAKKREAKIPKKIGRILSPPSSITERVYPLE